MSLSENIAKLRKLKGYSQAELANMIGVAQPNIAQYEKGIKVPTIVTGVDLARALDTTCEALVNE